MSASSRNDVVLSLDGGSTPIESTTRNSAPSSFFQSIPEQKESKEDFFLPYEVDIEDIEENGMLYPAAVIQAIEAVYADLPDNKYSKTDVRIRLAEYGFSDELLQYAIIKNNHKIYVVYKGETWSLKANQINPATGELKSYLAGKGNFGKVKDLQEIKTGEWSADKITLATEAIKPIEMKSLTDLGLIHFFGTYVSKKKGQQLHLVQRYLPHFDMFEALIPGNRFYNNKARMIKLFLSMALRVHELHQLGYVHCDIKPENFRLNALTDEVRLVDTGLSTFVGDPAIAGQKGTFGYMAPEIKQLGNRGLIRYTEKIDVYSLGETFFVLLGPYWKSSEQYPSSPYKDQGFCLELWNTLIAPMRRNIAEQRYSMTMAIDQLGKLEKAYPLDSSHREVDIQDFFTSIDKQEFIKSLCEFSGVVDVIDMKSVHTLKQYYEFQRALYTAGVRVGRCVLPIEAQTASDVISNAERKRVVAAIRTALSQPSNSSTVVEIEKLTALKNALANDQIKLYPDLLRRFSDCMPAVDAPEDLQIFEIENKMPDVLNGMKTEISNESSSLIGQEQVPVKIDASSHNKKSLWSAICCGFFSGKSTNTPTLPEPLNINIPNAASAQVRPNCN